MLRAIGYCESIECEDYLRGTFILNPGNKHYCAGCSMIGFIEPERQVDFGKGIPEPVYKTVRLHFNYDPAQRRYLEIAVVDITELDTGCVYEIYSPMIRTEKRALKVAELAICTLNSGQRFDESHRSELVLDMDLNKEEYDEQLKHVSKVLAERERRVANATRRV